MRRAGFFVGTVYISWMLTKLKKKSQLRLAHLAKKLIELASSAGSRTEPAEAMTHDNSQGRSRIVTMLYTSYVHSFRTSIEKVEPEDVDRNRMAES